MESNIIVIYQPASTWASSSGLPPPTLYYIHIAHHTLSEPNNTSHIHTYLVGDLARMCLLDFYANKKQRGHNNKTTTAIIIKTVVDQLFSFVLFCFLTVFSPNFRTNTRASMTSSTHCLFALFSFFLFGSFSGAFSFNYCDGGDR